MRCYKVVKTEYIVMIGEGMGGDEITYAEYNELKQIIKSAPVAPVGYDYRLNAVTLEWELVKLPPDPPKPITEEEALVRYSNELTGASDETLIETTETLIKKIIEEDS